MAQVRVIGPDNNEYVFPEGTDKAAAVAYFKRKGIGAAPAATKPTLPAAPAPKWYQPGGALEDITKPHWSDLLVGPAVGGLLRASKKGFQAAQNPLNTFLERNQQLEDAGVLQPSTLRRYPAEFLKSTARFGETMSDPLNAVMAAASLTPLGRLLVGAYGIGTGGKAALTPRAANETVPDYLERVLYGLAGVTGGVAGVASGGIRTPRQLLEQRLNRATYASGGEPGTNTAYRIALPDFDETIRTKGINVKTVADVAKVVESTNDRFNTYMALAEQPYANDPVMPTKAYNALISEADNLAPSQAGEAEALRAYARDNLQKPMSLRELGREVRHQNDLWRTHAEKSSLEQSTAQTRANVLINNVLRESLRDTYVDYLESKYPGAEFQSLRDRQAQVLRLREQLGTFNKKTGVFEKGHVEKLRDLQAARAGGPERPAVHGFAGKAGVKGYIRIPEFLRRGPETIANRKAQLAFKKPGPGRALKPLVRPQTPPGAAGAAAGAGGGGGQVIPPTGPRAGTPRYNYRGPIIEQEESEVEQARRRAPSTALTKSGPVYTRPAPRAGFGTGRGVENEGTASLKRQLGLARAGKSESHRGWETRIMKKMESAKAQGTDTQHFQAALQEIAPGRQFQDLPPAEMSRVIQRAQQLKQQAQGGK